MKNIHFILLGGLFVATCIILVTYPTWSPNKLSPEQIRHNVFVKANEQAIQQAKENTKLQYLKDNLSSWERTKPVKTKFEQLISEPVGVVLSISYSIPFKSN